MAVLNNQRVFQKVSPTKMPHDATCQKNYSKNLEHPNVAIFIRKMINTLW